MILTNIQKRRGFLQAIYIDNEYVIDIDREVLITSHFKIGSEISDDELYKLITSSNNKRAKERAFYYLSHRDYSRKELIEKLKKVFGNSAALFAVNRIEELGLINDESFARKYAHDLIFLKRHSPQRVERELLQKGIDKDTAIKVMEELDPNVNEQIRLLIERKYAKYLLDEKGKRKAVQALQRLGYRWDDIRPVLNEFLEKDY